MQSIASKPFTVSKGTRAFLGQPRRLLIAGQWMEAASGKTFSVFDPATGEELTQVA